MSRVYSRLKEDKNLGYESKVIIDYILTSLNEIMKRLDKMEKELKK